MESRVKALLLWNNRTHEDIDSKWVNLIQKRLDQLMDELVLEEVLPPAGNSIPAKESRVEELKALLRSI